MKYLKKYNESKSYQDLCKVYGVDDFTLNSDGSIDVEGSVSLYERGLFKLPVKYNQVGGHFDCGNNKLSSFKGMPKWVGGNFWCTNNKLVSLEGSPEYIGGVFDCRYNEIFEFEHFPKNIGSGVYCVCNPIHEIWKLFNDKSHIELLNDCDPFRLVDGKPAVILDRLNYFLELIGEEKVDKVDKYINL